MLGHLQVRQSSLPSPHRVLLFFLTPSQVPCGLNSCPIDSIAKPEELLTLVGYWVDRAGDLIDRWHNYSKIVQKDTRQVLTRSQSLLLYHTLLSLRVGKNRPCSGTASTTARTMPTEEACAGLSRPMIALASPANHVWRMRWRQFRAVKWWGQDLDPGSIDSKASALSHAASLNPQRALENQDPSLAPCLI